VTYSDNVNIQLTVLLVAKRACKVGSSDQNTIA